MESPLHAPWDSGKWHTHRPECSGPPVKPLGSGRQVEIPLPNEISHVSMPCTVNIRSSTEYKGPVWWNRRMGRASTRWHLLSPTWEWAQNTVLRVPPICRELANVACRIKSWAEHLGSVFRSECSSSMWWKCRIARVCNFPGLVPIPKLYKEKRRLQNVGVVYIFDQCMTKSQILLGLRSSMQTTVTMKVIALVHSSTILVADIAKWRIWLDGVKLTHMLQSSFTMTSYEKNKKIWCTHTIESRFYNRNV